ncbi:hypothetical protein [Altericista sp. CCNU0014]|uniref:hypothetical protein n=1 Tax=Altericista sp. CCNU0014 TaxID=3082949 RepID=UPI00384B373E
MVGSVLMVFSALGASAATLNTGDFPDTNFSLVSDTPTLLDLKFDNSPRYFFDSNFVPDDRFPLQSLAAFEVENVFDVTFINGFPFAPVKKGPVVPILTSDNWTVSAQNLIFPSVRPVPVGSIIFQQTIPGGSNVPQGALITGRLPIFESGLRKVSFLADASPPDTQTCVSGFSCSPARTFGTETCSAGSPNCVAFELRTTPSTTRSFGFADFELLGFFTPPNSPKPVSEPSMDIGALTAFGMMLLIRSRKFLSNKIFGVLERAETST